MRYCSFWSFGGEDRSHDFAQAPRFKELKKDEWVISRVFKKSGSGNGGEGAKKTGMSASVALYQEPNSPSSVSLPPLLDPTTTGTSFTDRDSCSYDSHNQSEHVSCFSTIAAAAASAAATATATTTTPPVYHPGFDLALPPPAPPQMTFDSIARYSRNVGVSMFPSLRSLQENLQLPFFFSQPTLASPPPLHGGSSVNWGAVSEVDNNGSGSGGKISMGPTELDCMWTY